MHAVTALLCPPTETTPPRALVASEVRDALMAASAARLRPFEHVTVRAGSGGLRLVVFVRRTQPDMLRFVQDVLSEQVSRPGPLYGWTATLPDPS